MEPTTVHVRVEQNTKQRAAKAPATLKEVILLLIAGAPCRSVAEIIRWRPSGSTSASATSDRTGS